MFCIVSVNISIFHMAAHCVTSSVRKQLKRLVRGLVKDSFLPLVVVSQYSTAHVHIHIIQCGQIAMVLTTIISMQFVAGKH